VLAYVAMRKLQPAKAPSLRAALDAVPSTPYPASTVDSAGATGVAVAMGWEPQSLIDVLGAGASGVGVRIVDGRARVVAFDIQYSESKLSR
jgi:hypothetical protein